MNTARRSAHSDPLIEGESVMRGTGGNRFISGDSDRTMLVAAVQRGLDDLHAWAEETGQRLDVGAISVTTIRIRSGAISVSVTGDLASEENE